MRACFAQGGRVVAGLSLLKTQQHPATGPATRVRAIANEDMRIACEQLAQHWGMDGYFSLDFVIDEDSGRALVIECNPRPVAWLHLGRLAGVDLIGPFIAAITHSHLAPQPEALQHDQEVALFPREWIRDPRSPFLSGPAHDVPWAYPALVTRLMQEGQRERAARAAAVRAAPLAS
jgi:predicted ATP-grasp superfamily ATP-dependent carboligase